MTKIIKPIKFKIELIGKDSSGEFVSLLHKQIMEFIEKISDHIQMADITTNIINEKYIISKIEEKTDIQKEKKNHEYNFDKYIDSLPKYNKKREVIALNYIKDYLTKNRSAKLKDIIKGCEEQGFKPTSEDPIPAFYSRLRKLKDAGKVTKKNKVYIWNYQEGD